MTRNRLTVFLAAAALAGCQSDRGASLAAPPFDPAAIEVELSQVVDRIEAGVVAGNLAAILAEHTDDLRGDATGFPTVNGKAAFEAALRPMFEARKYASSVLTPGWTTVISADAAEQAGSYVEEFTEGGKTSIEHGRFFYSFTRPSGGNWRVRYLNFLIDSTVAKQ